MIDGFVDIRSMNAFAESDDLSSFPVRLVFD
jgi:hypothetical protein